MKSADNKQVIHMSSRAVRQKNGLLQWQHCDSDTEWNAASRQFGVLASSHDDAPIRGGTASRWRWAQVGVVGLVLLGLLTGVAWRQARMGVAQVTQELHLALEAESRRLVLENITSSSTGSPAAQASGQVQLDREAERLHSLAAPGELVTMLDLVDLGQDRAVVQVELQATATAAYRQVRVYRQTSSGWTRVPPTAADWGTLQQAESEHLILNYYHRDARAVVDALPRVDALYSALYAALFPEAPGPTKVPAKAPTKVIVDVDPAWFAGQIDQPQPRHANLVVASPAATLLPAQLSPGDVLLQSISFALFEHLAAEAETRYALPEHWLPLRNGLRLWLLWQTDLPLAHWRIPVVRWVYWDPAIPTLPDNKSVPAFASQLCAEHQIWMNTPFHVGVPVHCWTSPEMGRKFSVHQYPYRRLLKPTIFLLSKPPIEPIETSYPLPLDPPFSEIAVMQVQIATQLEYAAATYGPERIPALLAALPHHATNNTLIPAVFGVSADDFETGWHKYLTERYDLAPW